jgi:hypothetical protein
VQDLKAQVRLAARDALEETLKNELRDLKKALEIQHAEAQNHAESSQKQFDEETVKVNQVHHSEMDALKFQIESLNRELCALRSQGTDHDKLVEENEQLKRAVVELDAAVIRSETKVCE